MKYYSGPGPRFSREDVKACDGLFLGRHPKVDKFCIALEFGLEICQPSQVVLKSVVIKEPTLIEWW